LKSNRERKEAEMKEPEGWSHLLRLISIQAICKTLLHIKKSPLSPVSF